MNQLQKLFEPIQVGTFAVRNRVVMPGMGTCFATVDGFVSDQTISYYARRAEGGVGLIIVGCACIDHPVGRVVPHQLRVDDDRYVPGLKELAAAVHLHGAKIALQLHHAGPVSLMEGGSYRVAPSPIPLAHKPDVVPRELTNQEIKELVTKFGLGAKRVKEAGFDAVELLCAHGYLLNRFLSPHANKRTDAYGGNQAKRIRILQEILDKIQLEAGKHLAILCKVPGDDYVDGGITIQESLAICKSLEELGVSAITVSGGSSEGRFYHIAPMGYPQGWQIHLAQQIKRELRIPIIGIGKIQKAEFAASIINNSKADMVAMGRALIADPDLVVKSQRLELNKVIPCISCNYCVNRIVEGRPLRCSVNPLVGREYGTQVMPAPRSRKVLIVGGGPAGMQAAALAASRGHEVTLFDKNERLGGQLLLASIPPDKEEINFFMSYLDDQLKYHKVDIKLNTEVNKNTLESINPEVVVVATGARPLMPPIPGIDLSNVLSAWDALAYADRVGETVIIIGGGMVGCEVACYLSKQGKNITIVEQLQDVGLDIGPPPDRKHQLQRLKEYGVNIITKSVAKEIRQNGIIVNDNGKARFITGDSIILAIGVKSERGLLEALSTAKMEVWAIGDCVVPRRIANATLHGFEVGHRL